MDKLMFRVWDSYEKIMLFRNENIISIFEKYLNNEKSNNGQDIKDRYHFNQYVCSKDKNGKEIYEGDLVRIYCSISGSKTKKFRTCKIVFEKFMGLAGFHIHILHKKEWWGHGSIDFTKGIEIIGNIYEDKHLLKEADNE